ncbi:copper resistance CopC family protein [Brucella pituitosa]|uniref:copper resistance CopC family protein n=1 Tax=Brucella pituitosa TaxID=571256 RepID=UPI0009A141D4|nr:copper resistance protein CopC [Brucella pituitosa]
MKNILVTLVMSTVIMSCNGAFAKPDLQFAIPTPNSVLSIAPPYYMLDFGTNMDREKTVVTLTGPDGKLIDLSPEEPYDNTAVGKITGKDAMGPGSYTLSWQIVGPRGQPANGSYSFTIAR